MGGKPSAPPAPEPTPAPPQAKASATNLESIDPTARGRTSMIVTGREGLGAAEVKKKAVLG